MKKFLLFISVLLMCFISDGFFAQNYQYLNSSTGNEREYPSDTSLNKLLYKTNTIVKLNKTYNFIWAKKYNGLHFKSLLMSKNGSFYFIAEHDSLVGVANYFGKINSNGNFSWCKKIPSSQGSDINLLRMIMDRNNNIVLTGSNGILLKTDTLGNLLKGKQIYSTRIFLTNPNILSDSAGIYTIAVYDYIFETYGATTFLYSDVADSVVTSFETLNGYGPIGTGNNGQWGYKILKSRNSPNNFYVFSKIAPSLGTYCCVDILKFRNNHIVWKSRIDNMDIEGIDEDYLSNLCVLVSNTNQTTSQKESFFYRIDSLGNAESYRYNYMNLFGASNVNSSAKDSVFNVSTVTGQYFYPSLLTHNYLHINRFAFFSGVMCIPKTYDSTTNGPFFMSTNQAGNYGYSVYDLGQMSLIDSSRIFIENIPFTYVYNQCWLTTNNATEKKLNETFSVYPNPTNGLLTIDYSLFDSAQSDNLNVIITNTLGEVVITEQLHSNNFTLKTNNLSSGIYFIELRNKDKLLGTKKFVKL